MVSEPSWESLLEGTPVPIEYKGVAPWRLPEATGGSGILVRTNLGPIRCMYHRAEGATQGIIWVSGAAGGFSGGGGLYPILSDELIEDGVSSLRLSYRKPNNFMHCMMDVLAGVSFLQDKGHERVALVGHSFGGAVVIAAAPLSEAVVTVVGLASQTYGAQYANLVTQDPCCWCTARRTPGWGHTAPSSSTTLRRSPRSWSSIQAPATVSASAGTSFTPFSRRGCSKS